MRICVDYTNLNKACPKDAYHLHSIDQLIDAIVGHLLQKDTIRSEW